MGIALTLLQYLDDRHIDYDTLVHGFSETAMKNAEAAHIPGERLVKAVILKDDTGYLMAVLPATRHIDFPTLKQALDRDVEMVEEDDLTTMFDDCDIGAIPPVGIAYGLQTIVEDLVPTHGDIYFEAGDHKTMIHLKAGAYDRLMAGAPHERFSFVE
jgi:Ala-tRNA(Pro) deacylase